MEEKSVILVTGKRFPELLHGPFRSRMFGHVAVNEKSGSDLKSNEHLKDLEAGRDGDKENRKQRFPAHGCEQTSTSAGLEIRRAAVGF